MRWKGFALAMFRRRCAWGFFIGIGLLVGNAAAQTQPAAGSPAATASPATPLNPATTAAITIFEDAGGIFCSGAAVERSGSFGNSIPFESYVCCERGYGVTGNGTYEEWWQSRTAGERKRRWGDYKYVVTKNGATARAYATGLYLPLRLRQAMLAVLVRFAADAGTSHKWNIQHTKLGGSDFAVLFKPDSCEGFEVACFQSYFTTDGMFRGRALNGRTQVKYNSLQPFQNLQIARNITKEMDGIPILRLSITSIEPLGASATILSQDASRRKIWWSCQWSICCSGIFRSEPSGVQGRTSG